MKDCLKTILKIGGILLLCAAAVAGARCVLERLPGRSGPMSEDFEE
ncbi:MAG TPA: hypothetical protein H9684_06675 [Firmicutes bacterium]|nr:hypothetical protein [Bacillota bacterium]